MKAGSGSILWLVFVFALVMVVKGLEAGSVLEPTPIDPGAPVAIRQNRCPTWSAHPLECLVQDT
jgi:hypothetical protein